MRITLNAEYEDRDGIVRTPTGYTKDQQGQTWIRYTREDEDGQIAHCSVTVQGWRSIHSGMRRGGLRDE